MTFRNKIYGTTLFTVLLLGACSVEASDGLPAEFDTACAETRLDKDCRVLSSSSTYFEDLPDIALQIQTGVSEDFGIGGGVVIYQNAGNGWQKLASDFEGYRYDLPTFAQREDGVVMHIAGVRTGTGSGNADLAFFAPYSEEGSPRAWQAIDLISWRDEISGNLPEGLEIWKGVDFDMGDWVSRYLTARTYLWKAETDANCCPTGGQALIFFDLDRNVLKIDRVEYDPDMPDDD